MKKDKKVHLLFVSIFFVFTFLIYAPLELYLTNINEFWFELSQFWFVVVILGVLSLTILLLVGWKMPQWMQEIYIAVIFSFSVMMYIQSNFLNMDVGVLNGGKVDWDSYRLKFLINFGIWILVISLCVCILTEKNKIGRQLVKYGSLFITLIQASTLVVLLLTCNPEVEKGVVMQYVSEKDIYEVSAEDNIIVFLMDMFDDRYFKELLKEEPELAEDFDGFTQYTNFTGNYSTTSYSVATLLTGQYLKNTEESLYDEINILYDDCTTFDKLADAGYLLDIYTYEGMIPKRLRDASDNYIEGGRRILDYMKFTKYLYRLVASRYMPDFVKQYVWLVGTEFDSVCEMSGEADAHSVDNIRFYEKLLKNGISVQKDNKCFKFIHLDAVHYPYTMNENAERVEESETSDLQCARGVVKILLEYLDGMKTAGVYDNSSIIITADHGYYWDGVITNPVLLVKPQNAVGAMKMSAAPVSQHDFHASILTFAGLNINGKYGEDYFNIPEDTERFFYQYYLQDDSVGGKYRLIEYKIDPEGNERKNFHLTGVEYTVDGKKINHFDNCQFCQSGQVEPNDHDARIVHK